jgi:dimethylaniline monooxygenase (N-oxide forming)
MSKSIVGIIGAGVSGIASGKECVKKGYSIKIFEKEDSIGGVWYTKSYPGCKLQTSGESYKFSDVEYPKGTPVYPGRDDVLTYLKDACTKYNLESFISYNSNVIDTEFIDQLSKWKISYIQNNSNTLKVFYCDYMMVASGVYGNDINQTLTSDTSLIGTKVFYSSEFSYTGSIQPSIFNNKKTVIIGNGPTGCDLACMAYENQASEIYVIYRSRRWIFQRYLWKTLSVHLYFTSRYFFAGVKYVPHQLYVVILVLYYHIVFLLLHGNFMFFPVPYTKRLTRLNFGMSEDFVNRVYKKQIHYIESSSTSIDKHYIHTGLKKIPYDIAILAIGYNSNIPYMKMDTVPYLYKHIIHPNIKNCGFIGFIGTYNCAQVFEMQAIWYLSYIEKKTHKTPQEMEAFIQSEITRNTHTDYDYHDMLVDYVLDYYELLAKESNIVSKYSIINPVYWFGVQGPKMWTYPNK